MIGSDEQEYLALRPFARVFRVLEAQLHHRHPSNRASLSPTGVVQALADFKYYSLESKELIMYCVHPVMFRILVFAMLLSCSSIVKAQSWVICDSCTTTSQFEYAARTRHSGVNGDEYFGVVNTSTGALVWVQVTYTPPGQDPRGAMPGVDFDSAQSGTITSSVPATEREVAKVQALIRVAKDQILFVAPDSPYFSSFSTAFYDYPAILDSQIRLVMSVNNPALSYEEIGPNLIRSLINALELYFGKGPAGCVVFNNGESACFQFNVLAPGALRYIDGTRKDVNGQPIPESNGVTNGGNRGVSVNRDPTGSPVGYTPVGSGRSLWIICGYSGGKLVSCYVE